MKQLLLWLILLCHFGLFAQPKKWTFTQPKMGSLFSIQVYSSDSLLVANTVAKAFAKVDSLNLAFSDYLPQSEISQLAAHWGQWQSVSDDLLAVLLTAQQAYHLSNGAFDISVGQLSRLWREARKTDRFPTKDEVHQTQKMGGMQYLEIDANTKKVRINKEGLLLDLGGIGKGYAAQKMLEIMQANGLNESLCDAAGNMAIGDVPMHKKGWVVAIALPNGQSYLQDITLYLSNIAISTSGDMFQFMTNQGKRYSHIINPKIGFGIRNQRQISVVCKDATQADWLSTACSVLSKNEAKKLIKKTSGRLIIFEQKNARIQEITY
jgi:thiamine biosynthesis lipoprotein